MPPQTVGSVRAASQAFCASAWPFSENHAGGKPMKPFLFSAAHVAV